MHKLIDTLKLNLPNDIAPYFSETYIEKAEKDDFNNAILLSLMSDNLISYDKLKTLKSNIKSQYLKNKYNVEINIKYNIVKDDLKDSYEKIKEYILEEFRLTNKIYYSLYKDSKVNIEDNMFTFSFYENKVLESSMIELINEIKNIYKNRFNKEISVKLGEMIKNDTKNSVKDNTNNNVNNNECETNGSVSQVDNNEKATFTSNDKTNNDTNENVIDEEKDSVIRILSTPRNKTFNNDDKIIFGLPSKKRKKIVSIKDINGDMQDVAVRGTIVNVTFKEVSSEKGTWIIYYFTLKDGDNFIIGEILWQKPEEKTFALSKLKVGLYVSVDCGLSYDKYIREVVLSKISMIEVLGKDEVIHIEQKPAENSYNVFVTKREDNEKVKRVELHMHTKASMNDGIASPEGIIAAARRFKMNAVAITDHGTVFGLSNAYKYMEHEKIKDLKLINGVEGYLVNNEYNYAFDLNKNNVDKIIDINGSFIIINTIVTGLNAKEDSILLLEALKVKNHVIIDKFKKYIKPEKEIDVGFLNEKGINKKDINKADNEEKVINEFINFIYEEDNPNIVLYDESANFLFLKNALSKYDKKNNITFIDSLAISELVLDELKTFNKRSVCKTLKVSEKNIIKIRNYEDSYSNDLYINYLIFLNLCNELNIKKDIVDLNEIKNKYTLSNASIQKLKSYHIIILAKNDIGRVNLYKLVSESNLKYKSLNKNFNARPRIPRSLILKYREGLILGTACVYGELIQGILKGASDDELINIASFYDYLEIQPHMNNSFLLNENKNFKTIEDLKNIDKKIIEIGDKLNKLVVATCDAHYIDKEEKVFREMLITGIYSKKKYQNANSIKDSESSSKEELYFRTTKEMLDEFSYLGVDKAYEVVVINTNKINDMIEYIDPVRPDKCPPIIEGADEDLRNITRKALNSIYGDNPNEIVLKRYNDELKVIIDNDYSVLYISAKKCIDFSNENGYPVGSRGSVGSSIIAFLLGVSEINPLPAHYVCKKCHHTEFPNDAFNITGFDLPDKVCPVCGEPLSKDGFNCPFETFLGVVGGKPKEPDIDLNFSGEIQNRVHEYTKELFGEKNSIRAGTINAVQRTTAKNYIYSYAKSKNEEFNKTYVAFSEDEIMGNRQSNGKHAGGTIILPEGEYIETFTPLELTLTENVITPTTLFDYHKIDENLLKLDLLGHDAPTLLKELCSITNIKLKDIPFYNEDIIDLFKSTKSLNITPDDIGGTKLGLLTIPEFGTDNCMSICEISKPQTVADLVRISGLSHGTNVWQGNVENLIKTNTCTIEEAICCRDDIMVYLESCNLDKKVAFDIMERVRKGKHLTEEYEKEMRNFNIPEWYIGCCNKIEYMFPKAHAAAYVSHALRLGYFKIHYPLEYYAVYFSIKKNGFDIRMCTMDKDEIKYYIKTIKSKFKSKFNKDIDDDDDNASKEYNGDIEISSNDIETTNMEDNETLAIESFAETLEKMKEDKLKQTLYALRVIEEMKARKIEFCPIDLYKAGGSNFNIYDNKIMPPFDSIPGVGPKVAELIDIEAKKGEFTSIEDLKDRTKIGNKILEIFKKYNIIKEDMKEQENTGIFEFI